MGTDKLRIETTADEQEDLLCGVAVTFSVRNGHLTVSEDWGCMDELYGPGCKIVVPARIWSEAAPWIAEHMGN